MKVLHTSERDYFIYLRVIIISYGYKVDDCLEISYLVLILGTDREQAPAGNMCIWGLFPPSGGK